MLTVVLTALFGSFLLSLVSTYAVRSWARRAGFVDRPSGRKGHAVPTAQGGGIAIFVSACLPVMAGTFFVYLLREGPFPDWLPSVVARHAAGISSKLPSVCAIVGGALVLHAMGLIDDRRALGPWVKFAVQVAVALFIAGPGGIRAAEALPAPVSVGLTVLWIVLITNAFNFLDNMDGLSAGVAAIAAVVFAVAATRAGQVFVPVMAWVLAGTLLGYLVFNFSPASIFMGDSGSLVIGFLMSVLTVLVTFYDPSQGLRPFGILMPVVVLAVPLYDVISVVLRRVKSGENPLRGDQRHFSHRLVKRGMSTRGAVLTIYLATAATALPAIVLATVDWVGAILLLLQCLCVVIMIAILEHVAPNHSAPG